jgi:TPR repeat protein
VATLRNHAARIGLGLAGLFLAVHLAMAQPTDTNSAETLANRLDQAIDAGDVSAAFRIAEMYRSGENQVPRDLARAVSLYKAAARLGNHPMAMNTLGILHEQGWGVKASQALALQWYSKADALENMDALNNRGYLHDEGLGTRRVAQGLGQGARLGQEGRQSGRAGSRRESHRHHGNYEERQKINTVT